MKSKVPNNYMFTEHEALADTPDAKKKEAFIAYCRKAIQGYENGQATLQDAAYAITGALSIPLISKTSEFEVIFDLAGELELPPEHISGNVQEKWKFLVTEVEAAVSRL
jgi:hypothetical protein